MYIGRLYSVLRKYKRKSKSKTKKSDKYPEVINHKIHTYDTQKPHQPKL